MAEEQKPFDPLEMLRVLDQHQVAYIVVGGFAAVIQGSPDLTDNLDIVPQMRPDNLERLAGAVEALVGRAPDGGEVNLDFDALRDAQITRIATSRGELHVVPEPAGTRGYDDLRRKATREPIARRLRPQVAALPDLVRSMHERARPEDEGRLRRLRRVAELSRTDDRLRRSR